MLLTSSLLTTTINGQDTIDTLKLFPTSVTENKKDTFKMTQDVEDIKIEQRAINEEMVDKLKELKKLLEEKKKKEDD